jgi:hypothetical protein
MTEFDLGELKEMAAKKDTTPLHLHWEGGDDAEVSGDTAKTVLEALNEEVKRSGKDEDEVFSSMYVVLESDRQDEIDEHEEIENEKLN